MNINAAFIAFNRIIITLKRSFLWRTEAGQFICWPAQQWRQVLHKKKGKKKNQRGPRKEM